MTDAVTNTAHTAHAATTADTRAEAFAKQSVEQLGRLQREMLALVQGVVRNGGKDVSARELGLRWEQLHNKRIGEGTVSSTINKLIAKGVLARSTAVRACAVTGYTIKPVYPVAQQQRLVN